MAAPTGISFLRGLLTGFRTVAIGGVAVTAPNGTPITVLNIPSGASGAYNAATGALDLTINPPPPAFVTGSGFWHSTNGALAPSASYGAAGQLPIGTGTDAAWQTVSGDATITSAGVVTVTGVGGTTLPAPSGIGAVPMYGIGGGTTIAWTSRWTPTDANTNLYYKFSETASPFANSGAAGTLAMTAQSGSIVQSRLGIFDNAVSNVVTATNSVATAVTQLGESASITITAWVYLRAYASFADFVIKQYRNDGTYTSPYCSAQMQLDNSGNGGIQFFVYIAGTARSVTGIGAADKIQLNAWTHIAMTYDSTVGTVTAYINGNAVGTATGSATAIDWGTHGSWAVLGNGLGAETMNGMIDDVRVESVARSASYIATMWRNGVGLYAAT